jgi:hypothetical protein
MKRLCLILCMAASTGAFAYEVELKKELNGLKIHTEAAAGPLARVILANNDKVIAHCRVEFHLGSGAPVNRAASIRPGKRAILTVPAPEGIDKMKVNADCKPPKSKGEPAKD